MNKSVLERFEDKYIPEPNSGCWLWTASLSKLGYGSFALGGGKLRSKAAHRIAWQLFCGEIPPGMEVCHSCDVRCCVNPEHLWLGTHAENMADCISKKRFVFAPRLVGGQAKQSKLSEAQVREIKTKQLHRSEYAAKFGVDPTYINNIQSGRVWAHIVVDPNLIKPPRVQTKENARKAAYLREWKRRRALAAAS